MHFFTIVRQILLAYQIHDVRPFYAYSSVLLSDFSLQFEILNFLENIMQQQHMEQDGNSPDFFNFPVVEQKPGIVLMALYLQHWR